MEVSGMKYQSQFPAAVDQRAEERDGIGSARETDGKTHPGFQEGGVERECGR